VLQRNTSGAVRARARSQPVQSKKAAAAGKPAQRVIKKYPNRRLYDTDTSTYITLAEVKHLVMDSESFVVRDAKTNEDLTRSILLQIILEEEAGGTPMFSEAALANLIRIYGHAAQAFMGTYLEKNVQTFTDIQAKLSEQSKTLTPEMWAQFMNMQNPLMQGMMGNYVEQSKSMFDKMQEQMSKQTEQMLGAWISPGKR
jgi:polyhydroxyalkanoate synthesis repressor PhaR